MGVEPSEQHVKPMVGEENHRATSRRGGSGVRLPFIVVFLIALVACGEAGVSDTSSTTGQAVTTIAVSTTLEPSTTTAPAPSTTLPPDAVPPEIRGHWKAVVPGTGEEVELLLFTKSWTLDRRFPDDPESRIRGSGKLTAEGDTIELSAGEFCQGVGTYTWVLQGEELTLASKGVDECGRSQVMNGITFTFAGPLP